MLNILQMAIDARAASKKLAILTSDQKNDALTRIADQLRTDWAFIEEANQKDIDSARVSGLSEAMIDRLLLKKSRWDAILADLLSVVHLPDPVGEIIEDNRAENGLHFSKVRVPMGVIAVIFESRPNVTVDVVGLCLKSGNAVILRGGKETLVTNTAIIASITKAVLSSVIPVGAIQFIGDNDKSFVLSLMKMYDQVDMLIPRGGASLHKFCRENSLIPVITGGIGICHLYVDESADLVRSIEVIRNAKIQRPSVCNALDTVLVNREVAAIFIPRLVDRLAADKVTFKADLTAFGTVSDRSYVSQAGPEDFDTEWLSLVLGIKVVDSIEEAISHIQAHSTAHSDGILSENPEHIQQFINQIDSAAVYVNASTRFTDGSQMGLGAEIAVSTQKMHARGPMALKELTSYKWVVKGNYNVRP